jgi:hypothetical protein
MAMELHVCFQRVLGRGAIYLQGIGLDGSTRSAGACAVLRNDRPNPDNAPGAKAAMMLQAVREGETLPKGPATLRKLVPEILQDTDENPSPRMRNLLDVPWCLQLRMGMSAMTVIHSSRTTKYLLPGE